MTTISLRRMVWLLPVLGILATIACNPDDKDESFHMVTLSASPASQSTAPGGSVQFTVLGHWFGAGALAVSLTTVDAPSGIVCAFSTPQIQSTTTSPVVSSSTATCTVANGTPPLNYTVKFKGTIGSESGEASVHVIVTGLPDFDLFSYVSQMDLVQGQAGMSAITITPIGGFSGQVALTTSGQPAGLTATITPPSSSTTATLSITASSQLAPGTYRVTLTGTYFDLVHSVTVTVNVTTAPGFTLTSTPPAVSVFQGGTTTITVGINRIGNLAGPVILAAAGMPAGVTATFNPINPTGNSSTLTLSAAPGAVPGGPVTFTVTGTNGQLTGQTNPQVTVLVNTNVTFDFSNCTSSGTIPFVTFLDGTGNWVPLTSPNNFYHATSTQATGAMGYVFSSGGFFTTSIQYYSQSELVAGNIVLCPSVLNDSNTMTANALGLLATDQAFVRLGGSLAAATSTLTTLTFNNIFSGNQDLVGYKSDVSSPALNNRGVLIRNVPVVNSTSLGGVDFNGGNSFVPASQSVPVALLGGETFGVAQNFFTGSACVGNLLWTSSNLPNPFLAFGVPTAQLAATDYHALTVTTTSANTNRIVTTWGHAVSALSAALPAAPAGVAVTNVAGAPYKRLNAVLNAPADIPNADAILRYNDPGNVHTMIVASSAAYRGVSFTFSLFTPDFSSVPGWSNSYAPSSVITAPWSITTSQGGTPSRCTDLATQKLTKVFGSN